MKRRAFTLVELLAVIVILAVIALITTPMIMNVIEKSKIGAFKDSVYQTFQEMQHYLVKNNLMQIPEEGIKVKNLEFKNNIFISGRLILDQSGNIKVSNASDGKYCAVGTKENLQVFKGECDLTTPRCELRIEEIIGVGGWYNLNPKVVMETSEALTGGLTFGIGKEENYNNEVKQGSVGKAEYQTTETTRVYCYVKNIGDSRGTNYIDVKIDQTAPEKATFSYTTTSKSIRVIASGKDQESGITRYQFSKDGGETWSDIISSNNYTFDNLQTGEYPIRVRVYNGTYVDSLKENNLYKESETKLVKTEDLIVPTYEVTPKAWTTGEVKLTIKYGEQGIKLLKTTVNVTSNLSATRCSNVYNGSYTCEGESTRDIEAEVWYLVDSDVELTYNENGSVIAQTVDGVNYKSGSSMVISNIDRINPTVGTSISGKVVTLNLEDNAELAGYTVTTTTEMPNSWTSVGGKSSSPTWTASSAGTYYTHVKDVAGNTAYVSFTLPQSSFQYNATVTISSYAATDVGHKHTGNRNSGGGCYTTQRQSCQTCTITTGAVSTSINPSGGYNWVNYTRHSSCGTPESTSFAGVRSYTGSEQHGTSTHSFGCSTYYELGCGKSETTAYICPAGGELSGSTCNVKTYTCPNGGTLSGTICKY